MIKSHAKSSASPEIPLPNRTGPGLQRLLNIQIAVEGRSNLARGSSRAIFSINARDGQKSFVYVVDRKSPRNYAKTNHLLMPDE